MRARHARRVRPPGKVLFLSGRSEDLFELKRRLGDTAQLVAGSASGDSISVIRRSLLDASNSVVIDRRWLPPKQLDAIESLVARTSPSSRILFLHDPDDGSASPLGLIRDVAVGEGESSTAYAAAVHYGLGRHDILIEAMQMLVPVLTTLGRDVVSEVLGTRFLFHRVTSIAKRLGVGRTQLHHLLSCAGDSSPKRLLDACYAMTAALILRDPMLSTNDLLLFIRAKEIRTPRDAVRRCTGMNLATFRCLAQRDWARTVSSWITIQLKEGAATCKPACSRTSPNVISSPASDRSTEGNVGSDANAGIERTSKSSLPPLVS